MNKIELIAIILLMGSTYGLGMSMFESDEVKERLGHIINLCCLGTLWMMIVTRIL